ncbi:hypothetical protein ACFV0R_17765 [Streptomyces sp. NPDC059578]|uniref:hypothetical protein n=1 Tax=unclassified Streptomyces TaxID=2593676 RepID=UPI0036589E46
MYVMRDHPEGGFYIVHGTSGHLAHIDRDGHQTAAIFEDRAEAEMCADALNVAEEERYW